MNEDEKIQLNQKLGNLERELAEIRKELDRKEDRPDKTKKYLGWAVMAILIIGFYSFYYFYIMSLF